MKQPESSRSINLVLLQLIFFRLYIPLLVLGIGAVLGGGYLSVQNQINKQYQVTRTMAQLVEYHLEQGGRILDAVVRASDGQDIAHASVFIRSTWESYGYFETLYYLDIEDRVTVLMPDDPRYSGLDLSNLPDIKSNKNPGQMTISRPYISVRTGEPTVLLIQNLPRAGRIVGELKLGVFQREITNIQDKSAMDSLFIADQNGTLLAHPQVALVRQQSNISNLDLFRQNIDKTQTSVYRYEGAYMIGTVSKITRTGWVVIDQVPLSDLGRGYAWILSEIIVFSLLVWGALWWGVHGQLRRRVVMPLEVLSRKTKALTEGDYPFADTFPGMPQAFRELERLAADFNLMCERLKAREQALRDSELRYRGLFDQVPIGLFRVDFSGRFQDVNPAFVNILGYPDRESLLRQSVFGILFRRSVNRRLDHFHLDESLNLAHLEIRCRRYDGSRIWVLIQGLCTRDTETGEYYCDGSIQDITERKKFVESLAESGRLLEKKVADRTRELKLANEELAALLAHLQTTQERLVQTEKFAALGALVAGISHELGTPIGNCMMLASTLNDALHEFEGEVAGGLRRSSLNRFLDDLSSGVDSLLRNLYRVAELVSNFKEVSVDQASSRRRHFDLQEIIHEIEIAQRPVLERAVCVFYNEVSAGIDLESYPGPLGQILVNLTSNALFHGLNGRTDGEIHVRAKCCGDDRVLLEFADNGCGIPAENIPKIFDPFFTTRLGQGGSGLGLHIVYNITTGILGGSIRVESSPEAGTRFLLELPLVAPIPDI